jgi:hypothetical protein
VCTHCAYHPCAIPPMCSSSAECSWECSSIGSPELQALAGFPSFTDKAEDMIECALTVPITHVPYHPCGGCVQTVVIWCVDASRAYHPCALSPMCPITHVPYHPCALSLTVPHHPCALSPMCHIIHCTISQWVAIFRPTLLGVWIHSHWHSQVCGCVQTVVVWCVDGSRV